MQAFFQRVDLAAHRQQVAQVAAQLKENPPPRALTPPPKRSVGRPKRERSAEEVLAAATVADALELPEHKRGKYTHWFNSHQRHPARTRSPRWQRSPGGCFSSTERSRSQIRAPVSLYCGIMVRQRTTERATQVRAGRGTCSSAWQGPLSRLTGRSWRRRRHLRHSAEAAQRRYSSQLSHHTLGDACCAARQAPCSLESADSVANMDLKLGAPQSSFAVSLARSHYCRFKAPR